MPLTENWVNHNVSLFYSINVFFHVYFVSPFDNNMRLQFISRVWI